MILRARMIGVALLAVATTVPAAADDYVDAVGVLFGYGLRHPYNTTKTEGNAHLGVNASPAEPVSSRSANIVAPRPDNRCLLDVVNSVHDDQAGGELRQAVVDLRQVRQVEISGPAAQVVIEVKGSNLVCERAIGLPSHREPMAATAMVCHDSQVFYGVGPDTSEQLVQALRVVAKACDLPLEER